MLLDQIQTDLKNAQLSRDEVKVSTLRLLLSEVKNKEIVKGEPLSGEDIISVIAREVKKRTEAAEGFRKGGREDSAVKEENEAKVLANYLPARMEDEELTKIIEETINELGASSMQDMGRVMGVVMGKVKGQADGGAVSAIVKDKLTT